jgi:hypothetical protein
VIKSVREIDNPEKCPKGCAGASIRNFIPSRIHLSNTAVQEATYNPGLGQVVRNKSHLKEICKEKNLIELGSEKPETIHKMYDNERQRKWEANWESTTKGWVGNGE